MQHLNIYQDSTNRYGRETFALGTRGGRPLAIITRLGRAYYRGVRGRKPTIDETWTRLRAATIPAVVRRELARVAGIN